MPWPLAGSPTRTPTRFLKRGRSSVARDAAWTLRLVGMSEDDRIRAGERIAALGIADRVVLMPWLDDEQFAQSFVSASLIVFPSEFEGFGLPAVEAMRLGIPLVVSADPALGEVTGGHAVIATDLTPLGLAASMRQAVARSAEELAAAQAWAERFSWDRHGRRRARCTGGPSGVTAGRLKEPLRLLRRCDRRLFDSVRDDESQTNFPRSALLDPAHHGDRARRRGIRGVRGRFARNSHGHDGHVPGRCEGQRGHLRRG